MNQKTRNIDFKSKVNKRVSDLYMGIKNEGLKSFWILQ